MHTCCGLMLPLDASRSYVRVRKSKTVVSWSPHSVRLPRSASRAAAAARRGRPPRPTPAPTLAFVCRQPRKAPPRRTAACGPRLEEVDESRAAARGERRRAKVAERRGDHLRKDARRDAAAEQRGDVARVHGREQRAPPRVSGPHFKRFHEASNSARPGRRGGLSKPRRVLRAPSRPLF